MILDPRVETTSFLVTDLPLCQVRLNENACFPWILLIPKRENIVEIIDLPEEDRLQLMKEIALASHVMKDLFSPTKLNVASLGNIVPQLHLHIIARYESDPAWPGPVWGREAFQAYPAPEKERTLKALQQGFLGRAFSLHSAKS